MVTIRRVILGKDVGRLYPVSLSLRNHGASPHYARPPLTSRIPVWYSAHALGKIADHGWSGSGSKHSVLHCAPE